MQTFLKNNVRLIKYNLSFDTAILVWEENPSGTTPRGNQIVSFASEDRGMSLSETRISRAGGATPRLYQHDAFILLSLLISKRQIEMKRVLRQWNSNIV